MDGIWLRETASLVALLRLSKGVRWPEIAMAVEDRGSASAVLEEGDAAQESLLPTRGASEAELGDIEREIEGWLAEGMQVITVLDETYPATLRTVHQMPPLLFVRGTLTEQDERAIAVVGSRAATPAALERAGQIAEELAERGYVVVSGLAKGIDTAAHRGALEAGGRTIAILGTGLHLSYPPENAELQRQLSEETAVISQFWPDQPPTKSTFPMRNAVMSGFANATVVVEAQQRSGARMQARLAFEHGRPVFLPRQLVDEQEWAQKYERHPNTFAIDAPGEIADRIDSLLSLETLVA